MVRILTAVVFWILMSFCAVAQNADIEATIRNQLQAFLADDFNEAFTYADDSIKNIFQTPEQFGAMVTNGYPMVHRPQSYEFQELREIAGGLYQNVLIQDALGNYHIAEYAMRATSDGWKIRGVRILPAPDIGT